jgi:hypothetical protein
MDAMRIWQRDVKRVKAGNMHQYFIDLVHIMHRLCDWNTFFGREILASRVVGVDIEPILNWRQLEDILRYAYSFIIALSDSFTTLMGVGCQCKASGAVRPILSDHLHLTLKWQTV